MGRRFSDEGESSKNEEYNAYNLFLILILLILSQDVLQMLTKKKNSAKKKTETNRRKLNILPIQEKKNKDKTVKEPEEEKGE